MRIKEVDGKFKEIQACQPKQPQFLILPASQVCDNCSPAKELTCPTATVCDFSLLKQTTNSEKCLTYDCKQGSLLAQVGQQPEAITSAVCDRNNQLIWKTSGGELLGRNLQATCGFPCTNCNALTCEETPCPPGYDCAVCSESPIVYSINPQGCAVATCGSGQMFSKGQAAQQATCADGGYLINGQIVSQVACGLPCTTCTVLQPDGLTCPEGLVCAPVSKREGQCSEAYCPAGVMNADGVQVNFLSCNGKGQWVDNAGTVYTNAHCEMSCELCKAISNSGMPCPAGLICEAPLEREGTCKEEYCPKGELRGNPARTLLSSLTCNGMSQWVDSQNAVYTSAQCEYPCDQCTELCVCGLTCPTGFVCTPVVSEAGQCPAATCPVGTMRASPGNVIVTSLTCNGEAQWVDDQETVYTSAQCEAPCTECPAISNSGMECPKGLLCKVPSTREGQCPEAYCEKGVLTGNPERTTLALLTCDENAQWVDGSTPYTVAQCESPCDRCPALTNDGMTCLTGFRCTQVLTRNTGQCPEVYCETGLMTAGSGRTTVTSLSCDGEQQWIDSASTVYDSAQCETGCTCQPLTITASPIRLMPSRGNALSADADGCSTLGMGCRTSDIYRLVTSEGVVTLEPPAGRQTPMTCVDGQWKATINGAETTVTEQACYAFACTSCADVQAGVGVTITTTYDATSWCKQVNLSGCPNGYRPFVYSESAEGCKIARCTQGQMFANGQPTTEAFCASGDYVDVTNEQRITSASCGLRCDTCTALTTDGLTCPEGSTCTAVSIREAQCKEAYCPAGQMTANGAQVDLLTCNGQGKWVDEAGTEYTAAQCEMSCENCEALSNAGISCPIGLTCEAPTERQGECKESYCPKGELRGSPTRILLTSLTCNAMSQWIDDQNTVYSSAQCEYPCNQCTDLCICGMTCPVGFVCTAVETQAGQCPVAGCLSGVMRASPGEVIVPSLTCDGDAQWVDEQNKVYTSAQCEESCTECTALTNSGMDCPKGFLCEPATRREAQCSETYCPTGALTGNLARTMLGVLTCDVTAEWLDAQSASYTVAQCEIPCDRCPALTRTGMSCPSGIVCTSVMTRNTGQCPESYCESGSMTAGSGRTTVTSLSCNGAQQWVDSQSTVYTSAQCETSCICPPLPITTPPPSMTVRGNALTMANGCSTLGTGCRASDQFRLVTPNGVVTLEPPAGRTSTWTCDGGQWKITINGVPTIVQEQACYSFGCTSCNGVRAGTGVILTLAYDPTTWCSTYALSGCPNGYRVGSTAITSTLTCNQNSRWTSGAFTSPNAGLLTVNCV
ncbi:unnamed protein product [Cylicocyclus nassatus]|uniref:Uncharacterized protein n=1 Tax=Cylicocyclus nassatus TaxID=53992 RepID=A0AA36GP55_CYLNA|nr:unnamed protein product [Cylicocyclus nassatus]